MKLGKIVATAAFATMAVAVGSGTASADPAAIVGTPSMAQGSAQGVEYAATAEPSNGTVTTVLDTGTFRIEADGRQVSVVRSDGAVVGALPLSYRLDGRMFPIAGSVGNDGRTLTLTPQQNPLPIEQVRIDDPAAQQKLMEEVQKNQAGAIIGNVVGSIVGLAVGCVIGVIGGCIPGLIVGGVVGAVIGMDIQGGPPMREAFFEFISP
ncbi:hypothetical protein [Rhodococcus xishaensis]|uniref:DUF8020 domain-containing protein n=1 Tax=Rhodococcus xishaensis TaxID=2487364 RepID=A0A438ATS0_9NOCA|nr:hypothetical protein [Rhodococcus xishaensis]RVW02069.1 hypothetical protein EGT50_11655 [Rhodococcus xishaensis]